jgi:uncharacterized protein YegL
MKTLLTFLLLLPLLDKAQSVVNFTMTLNNNKGAPMGNTPVTLIETTSKQRVSKNTDAAGKAKFEITSGKEWKIQVLKIENIGTIEVPEMGMSNRSKLFTYDLERWERTHRPAVNRKALGITQAQQPALTAENMDKVVTVRVNVKKEDKSELTNFPVTLTCYNLKNSFQSYTNSKGVATFYVPVNNEYELDIDGVESFNYVDVTHPGSYDVSIIYEPTAIKETNKNDTITQAFAARTTGTSGRTLLDLSISCSDCENMSKEPIYLQEVGGSKVYTARLDKNGNVKFLLPIKKKYLISFKYDFDVDVINLKDIVGISNASKSIQYTPRPELKYPERYLAMPSSFILAEMDNFTPKDVINSDGSPVSLKAKWGNELVNAKSKEALLSLQLTVKIPKNSVYVSPPLNVAFVLDKSGSMAGSERIENLKTNMLKYSEILRPTDRVSLVAFDNSATVLMPSQAMGNKTYFTDMVKDLEAGGGTNIFDGLHKGYDEVLKNMKPGQVNRVILLTDGYDGIPVDSTVNMSKRYNRKGIQISAIGVGDDYNYSLLNLLALNGGGALRLSPKPKDLDIVMQQEFGSMISQVGSNAKVKISFGSDFVCRETFGMPLKKESDKLYSITYDVLFDGQNNLGLLKFDLMNVTKDIEKSPITVTITYFDNVQKKEVTKEEKIYLKWQDADGQIDFVLDSYVKKLYSIAYVNHALKMMDESFNSQNYEALYASVGNLIQKLENYYAQPTDKDIVSLLRSLKKYTTSVDVVIKNNKSKKG